MRSSIRQPHSRASGRKAAASTACLRIIGGQWRSRQIRFPAVDDVRPTPDRVRETLFNWLMPVIAGSRVLDLFSGSGANGLEALSRGAAQARFVDRSPRLCQALRDNLQRLGSTTQQAQVIERDALTYLSAPPDTAMDIVFMDPPFRQGWVERLCAQLDAQGWVREHSRVYVEHEKELGEPEVPSHWTCLREKQAGQVCYRLYSVGARSATTADSAAARTEHT